MEAAAVLGVRQVWATLLDDLPTAEGGAAQTSANFKLGRKLGTSSSGRSISGVPAEAAAACSEQLA